MLNVERLMASELVALSSHEVIAAALLLWCRAWKQMPAASLPDDERVIAAFAKLPLARFRKLAKQIMRGFIKCSDGRWYHSILAESARSAFERKQAFRHKRETEAERLRKWRESKRETHIETRTETRFVPEGEGEGEGEGEVLNTKAESTPAQLAAPARFDPAKLPMPDGVKIERWGEWIAYRRKRKLTTTEPTMRKQLEFLTKCQTRGQPPDDVIEASIANGWQGLFELKTGAGNGKNGSSRAERVSATIAELTGASRNASATIDGTSTRVD